jgi:hypothetical protein
MKIIDAKPLANFRLEILFDQGASGTVDLADLAGHGVFDAWNVPGIFEAVSVTDEGAVRWPGDIDLCPDALYLRMTGKRVDEIFPALNDQAAHA